MSRAPRDLDPDERAVLDALQADLARIRARHAADPPLDMLRHGHADALPQDLQDSARQHLESSAWSRALVAGFGDADAALSADDEARLLNRIRGQAADRAPWWAWLRGWRPALVAASAAALLLVTVRPWDDVAVAPDVPAVVPAPDVPLAAPPASLIPLDRPEVKISLSALTWRGVAADDNPLLVDLKPGLDAFRAGDHAAAERSLGTLAARYPDAVEVFFYRGVAQLFLDDARGAGESLGRAEALADATFAADVKWYRALADHRSGNDGEARRRLEELCRAQSDRQTQACGALKQLTPSAGTPQP